MNKFRLLTRYISQNGKIYEPYDVVEQGELPAAVESYLISSNRMIAAAGIATAMTDETAADIEPAPEPKKVKRKPGRPRKYETREMRA